MRNKKTILFILSLSACFLFLTNFASAHFLQTDGAFSVIMHVNPDDSPIIAKPTTLFFQIQDSQGKFNPDHCNCTVTILENGRKLLQTPLIKVASEASIFNFSAGFTFPEKGIYNIIVKGDPIISKAFVSFMVQYSLRVDREDVSGNLVKTYEPVAQGTHYLYYTFLALVVIVSLLLTFKQFKNNLKE